LVPKATTIAYLRNPTNPVFAESEARELHALSSHFGPHEVDAGDISARPVETIDESNPDRVGSLHKNDRDRLGRRVRFASESGHPISVSSHRWPNDRNNGADEGSDHWGAVTGLRALTVWRLSLGSSRLPNDYPSEQ
jgi:hypothetical protein